MGREEFLQLALETEETLFHVAFSILHDEQNCADAVQETLLKAYTHRNKLRERAYFKTWIVRILINECYTMVRKNKRFSPLEEGVMSDRNSLTNYVKEEYLDLYQAIERLEEKEKICILLFYMEDYSVTEIARILSIPEGTVKSRLSRARSRLKGVLGE